MTWYAFATLFVLPSVGSVTGSTQESGSASFVVISAMLKRMSVVVSMIKTREKIRVGSTAA